LSYLNGYPIAIDQFTCFDLTKSDKRFLLLLESKKISKLRSTLMGNGGMKLSKPNFQAMTLNELRQYVLAHRDDREAWNEFAARPRPNAIIVPADTPVAEQERIVKDLVDRSK
jgi:hypothetical protein